MSGAKETRWIGLRSYTEADNELYFGRSEDSEKLYRQILRQPVTVVFGVSGIGKTSLINASLLPRLKQDVFLPVTIRLDFSAAGSHTQKIISRFKEAVRNLSCDLEELSPPVNTNKETLWEFFHRIEIWDQKNRLITPVLIFDQFEEIFTLGKEKSDTSNILTEMADLLENQIPASLNEELHIQQRALKLPCERQDYKILISMREDFVPMLDRLKKQIPSLMNHRYPLQHLNGKQAMEIIMGPGSDIVETDVAEKIIRFVAANKGTDEDLEDCEIEVALLSVVCAELDFNRQQQGNDKITAQQVDEQSENILRQFYERSLEDISRETKLFVENSLLTRGGYRRVVPMEEALDSNIAEEELKSLVERRILRIEERLGIPNIELSHDLLAKVVRESRDERVKQEIIDAEAKRLEEESIEDRKRFRKKVKKRIIYCCLFLIVIYFTVTWWLGTRYERELAKFRKAGVPTKYEEAFPNQPEIHELENAYNDAKIVSDLLRDPTDGSDVSKIEGMIYDRKKISSKTKRNLPLEDIQSAYETDYRLLDEDGKKEIRDILERKEIKQITNQLLILSKKKYYDGNLDYDKGFELLLPNLNYFRTAVKILCLEAVIKAQNGDVNAGLKNILMVLKISDLVAQEKILISNLVATACTQIAVNHLQTILETNPQIDEQIIQDIKQQAFFMSQNRIKKLQNSFKTEYIAVSQIFARIISGDIKGDDLQFFDFPHKVIPMQLIELEHLYFCEMYDLYTRNATLNYQELQKNAF